MDFMQSFQTECPQGKLRSITFNVLENMASTITLFQRPCNIKLSDSGNSPAEVSIEFGGVTGSLMLEFSHSVSEVEFLEKLGSLKDDEIDNLIKNAEICGIRDENDTFNSNNRNDNNINNHNINNFEQPHWPQTNAIVAIVALDLHKNYNININKNNRNDKARINDINNIINNNKVHINNNFEQPHWPQTNAIDAEVSLDLHINNNIINKNNNNINNNNINNNITNNTNNISNNNCNHFGNSINTNYIHPTTNISNRNNTTTIIRGNRMRPPTRNTNNNLKWEQTYIKDSKSIPRIENYKVTKFSVLAINNVTKGPTTIFVSKPQFKLPINSIIGDGINVSAYPSSRLTITKSPATFFTKKITSQTLAAAFLAIEVSPIILDWYRGIITSEECVRGVSRATTSSIFCYAGMFVFGFFTGGVGWIATISSMIVGGVASYSGGRLFDIVSVVFKDPRDVALKKAFSFLNLEESAPVSEIEGRYSSLCEKYSRDRDDRKLIELNTYLEIIRVHLVEQNRSLEREVDQEYFPSSNIFYVRDFRLNDQKELPRRKIIEISNGESLRSLLEANNLPTDCVAGPWGSLCSSDELDQPPVSHEPYDIYPEERFVTLNVENDNKPILIRLVDRLSFPSITLLFALRGYISDDQSILPSNCPVLPENSCIGHYPSDKLGLEVINGPPTKIVLKNESFLPFDSISLLLHPNACVGDVLEFIAHQYESELALFSLSLLNEEGERISLNSEPEISKISLEQGPLAFILNNASHTSLVEVKLHNIEKQVPCFVDQLISNFIQTILLSFECKREEVSLYLDAPQGAIQLSPADSLSSNVNSLNGARFLLR